jgi:hypothetical protein
MAEQPVVIQKISWADLCPWTIIFRTLPIASGMTVLTLALLAVVLTPIGWMLSEMVFVNAEMQQDPAMSELVELIELNNSPYRGVFEATENHANAINVYGMHLSGPRMVFQQFINPFVNLFNGQWGLRGFLYLLFGCLWTLFVWTFAGLGITRVSLLKLTRNEQSGLDDAFEYSLDHWLTAAGAVGIPLIAVAVLCIPTFVFGLLMGFDVGVLIAGIFWFLVMIASTIMAILLLGLMFGWPLMVSSVGCEGQNSFDAMTRSYAYAFQRPLHYMFYMLIAILFGGFCWMVVCGLTNAVIDLSFWSTSWGSNIVASGRIEQVQGGIIEIDKAPDSISGALTAGRNMIGLWNALLKTLAAAFIYGLFWCMASAIYLLLRKDVDETELDEIYLADEKRTYELPPLQSDENGIPQIQQPRPVDETTEDDQAAE